VASDAELIEKVRIFAKYDARDDNPDYEKGYRDCLADLMDLINIPDA
jgi:hypothetical protein